MAATTRIEQQQIDDFQVLIGKRGNHAELADTCEAIGLFVQIDSDDNERSVVLLPGCFNPDGSDIVLGVIRGDCEAEIFPP